MRRLRQRPQLYRQHPLFGCNPPCSVDIAPCHVGIASCYGCKSIYLVCNGHYYVGITSNSSLKSECEKLKAVNFSVARLLLAVKKFNLKNFKSIVILEVAEPGSQNLHHRLTQLTFWFYLI
ncbi:hypothetical protein V6N11_051159 [Hibiscus sabdariffa]|uniref:Uncharacterized protein n=1 Tax=Hibiscus sabdariffa TaxID=183260 RepID=A0ABR2R313_9ROSI